MHIPHNGLILVADGSKMLFFRNGGDDQFLNLVVESKQAQDNPPDRDQKSDAPGRSFASVGAARSGYEEVDFHQQEEDRFAAEAADILKRGALGNEYDALVVVAPPRTLGEMRKHYHKEVEKRLTGEIAKDLTSHPVEEIEKILQAE